MIGRTLSGWHRSLALLALSLFTTPAAADPPAASRFSLPNGLDVVLVPDPRRAQVVVRVDYGAGLADDPPGYPETAHLVEHLLFRGTRHTNGPLWRAMSEFGVTARNGVTSDSHTSYFEVAASDQLERLLWLESERMGFGSDAITPENAALEREIVWREHVGHVAEVSLAGAQLTLLGELFPAGHPWRASTGVVEERARLTHDAALWFFRQWYAPGNARLTVVGGFDPAPARAAVERWFGAIPARSFRARPPPPPVAPPERPVEVTLAAPVRADRLVVGWITPALREPGDAELDVFARRLRGALDALDDGAVTGYSLGQNSREGASFFGVAMTLRQGAPAALARRALDAALSASLERCERDEWFDDARRVEAARYATPTDDLVARAAAVARDPDPEDPGAYARDARRMSALDLAGTCAAARRWLDPRRRVAVTVVADPDAPSPFRRLAAPEGR